MIQRVPDVTSTTAHPLRIVVGISGASGIIYGVETLKALRELGVESHLVVTRAAKLTLAEEVQMVPEELRALADYAYAEDDLAAPIASGSFATSGMIVAPCSIKSLSGIAHSYADNLLTRTADVTLKEGRPLVLVVRETPLHLGHLRLMVSAAEIGATIFPPVPAFYAHPATLDDVVRHHVGRVLTRIGIPNTLVPPWMGCRERHP